MSMNSDDIDDLDLIAEEKAVLLEAESSINKIRSLVPLPVADPKPRDCPICGEDIPIARLKLGFKICVECSR